MRNRAHIQSNVYLASYNLGRCTPEGNGTGWGALIGSCASGGISEVTDQTRSPICGGGTVYGKGDAQGKGVG